MCVLASSSYLAILLAAAWFATAHASVAVSPMCDSAYVSGTVTSQANGLPLDHGINLLPSGRFQCCTIKFVGSSVIEIYTRFTALHRISFIELLFIYYYYYY